MTSGKVEQASCFENNGTWVTDVSYSYTVAGEFFSGQFQLKEAKSERSDNPMEGSEYLGPVFAKETGAFRSQN